MYVEGPHVEAVVGTLVLSVFCPIKRVRTVGQSNYVNSGPYCSDWIDLRREFRCDVYGLKPALCWTGSGWGHNYAV